jgi:DNA-binding MarR family transcriptional regulator
MLRVTLGRQSTVLTSLSLSSLPKSLYAVVIIRYQCSNRLTMTGLYFGGSVWCNVDIALRNVDVVYKQEIEPLGLTVIEWYVLRTLYAEDGQMASRLADAIGRPATSFTPILDGLESKGFIERKPHSADRRAVRIYLTAKGKALEEQVKASAERIESKIRQHLSDKDWQGYASVIADLQTMTP